MKSHHQPYKLPSSLYENHITGMMVICYHHHFMKITPQTLCWYVIIITSWTSHHRPYVDMSSSSLHENHTTDLMLICHHHHFMNITPQTLCWYVIIITSWTSHHRPYVDMSSSSLHEHHTTDLMLICHHHHFMNITPSAIWLVIWYHQDAAHETTGTHWHECTASPHTVMFLLLNSHNNKGKFIDFIN